MRSCLCFCLLIYLGYWLQSSNAQWLVDPVVEDEGCRTPDQEIGNCIPLSECAPMANVFKTIKIPISQTSLNRLQAYTCGRTINSIKVCCPPQAIIYNPQDLYHNRKVPPDVSNHRNMDLLPTNCGFLDDTLIQDETAAPARSRREASSPSGNLSNSQPAHSPMGGEDAYMNEYPWMALLQYKTSQGLEFLCGGTIISWNYILTAGQCVDQGLVSVRVGEYSLKNSTDCEVQRDRKRTIKCNPPVQDLRIEKIIVHPQFIRKDKNVFNDMALLRVSKITKAENVFPVCLPVGELRDAAFYYGFVAGWGVSDSRRKLRADILKKLGHPIAEKSTCEASYKEIGVDLARTQICVGKDDGRRSCAGDSGGPLLVAGFIDESFIYVQQGIATAGPVLCELTRYPGIYTGVKFYMDWILDNMES